MIGYYLPRYNFSVRYHNGAWCQFARLPDDLPAATAEQVAAVEDWAEINSRKFCF